MNPTQYEFFRRKKAPMEFKSKHTKKSQKGSYSERKQLTKTLLNQIMKQRLEGRRSSLVVSSPVNPGRLLTSKDIKIIETKKKNSIKFNNRLPVMDIPVTLSGRLIKPRDFYKADVPTKTVFYAK
jgi:hypothetical protein